MRVLFVASGNHAHAAPFVEEQAESLRQEGCEVRLFTVQGHGPMGYLRNLKPLQEAVRTFSPHVVHAHYGLCGLLGTLQRQVPTVVTYHGSDINNRTALFFSRLAMHHAAANIFVSREIMTRAGAAAKRASVIPCGVPFDIFTPISREKARRQMGLDPDGQYVLFAGAFANPVKNAPLARSATQQMPAVKLIEMVGYRRDEVATLMAAADALLLTSHSEGSPQVVKEALSMGLPVVSVDVGDVSTLLHATDGGTITESTPEAIATALRPLLTYPRRTDARSGLITMGLDAKSVAQRLISIYNTL